MKKIIESLLFSPHGKIVSTNEFDLESSFANHLLWYDQILIPTIEFEELVKIYSWMGERAFQILIEEEIIRFIRYQGYIAQFFETENKKSNTFLTSKRRVGKAIAKPTIFMVFKHRKIQF